MKKIKIARVVDGDTVKDSEGNDYRLYGVDAPKKKQEYGKQAADVLNYFFSQHSNIVYLQNHGRDKRGRTLATLFTTNSPDQDWQNLNYMLIEMGYAWVYRFKKEETKLGSPIQPALDKYEIGMEKARQGRRGLWAEMNPESPRRTHPKAKPCHNFNYQWNDDPSIGILDISKLWHLTRNHPLVSIETLKLDYLLDAPIWSCDENELQHSDEEHMVTPRQILSNHNLCPGHWERILKADVKYPLLVLWPDGSSVPTDILDGFHRLAQNVLRQRKTTNIIVVSRAEMEHARPN